MLSAQRLAQTGDIQMNFRDDSGSLACSGMCTKLELYSLHQQCTCIMQQGALLHAICCAACINCMYQLLCVHVVLYLRTYTGRLYNPASHWLVP